LAGLAEFLAENRVMSIGRSMTRPARYAVLAAGGLPALAFPAPGVAPLAWIALVPGLLLIQRAGSAREAAVRGGWFGTGYMLATIWWLTPNLGPAVLLVAIVLGAAWTGVGLATWALLRPPVTARRALAALVVVPSGWLVVELIRSWQALGGPWGLLGASQWQHPVMLALAALGGVWLISAALVAANTGILIAVISRATPVRLAGALAAAACIAAGPVAYALARPAAPVAALTVALVQPGIVRDAQIRVDASQRITASLAAHAPAVRADLIVWGESSVAYNLDTDTALLRQIRALSARMGAPILVNQDAPRGDGHISKVAVLVGPAGIEGSYEKSRLVPFGEYIPLRRYLGWLTQISKAAKSNRIPGTGTHLLTVAGPAGRTLPIGVLICFESAFPDMSRVAADKGAELIVYQSATSTFQDSWAPQQHASLGALRAAETGRPVVQAALTGVSAAYDSRGRDIAWLAASRHGVVVVRLALPAGSARTLYDRLGEYVPFTATGIAAVAALYGLAGRRRSRRLRAVAARPATQPAAPRDHADHDRG
jgi:apolipoprotein N-acyltransferase